MTPKESVPSGYGSRVALDLGGRRKTSLLIDSRVITTFDDRSPELRYEVIRNIEIFSTEDEEPITVCEARGLPGNKDVVLFPMALKPRFDAMIKPWEKSEKE